MYSWWMYIRAMFEEQYILEKNPFECIVEEVRNGYGRCICIPCVAVNYIANEIKFWEKATNKNLSWGFIWEEEHKIYLVKRESEDWNKDIYDIRAQGKTLIDNAELCLIEPTGYSYIKVRDQEILQEVFEDPSKILCILLTDVGECKTEIEIYTTVARDFRNEFSMEEYIDRLFRLTFFFHPLEGLKVIERNMKESDSKDLKKYNERLLEDYQKLINGLERLNESNDRVNPLKILEQIGEFVGGNILTIYIYLKESDRYGDIKTAHELFQKKMNDTIKLGSLGRDSRINRIKRKYLSAY